MALIAMAVWDTEENRRTELTAKTLQCLYETVDHAKHRIIVVDNNSCEETKQLYRTWMEIYKGYSEWTNFEPLQVIYMNENIGTARAINQAWLLRKPGENAIKMDNDVLIHQNHWLDILEECIVREPKVGIIGLKRMDCIETPWHPMDWYRSELLMLPHELGQPWLIVEKVHHVMGTCQLYSSACLDQIGYLYQMGGFYGFDDALASIRAQVAGFITVHYSHIRITQMDVSDVKLDDDPYTNWKHTYSSRLMDRYNAYRIGLQHGDIPVYNGPEDL